MKSTEEYPLSDRFMEQYKMLDGQSNSRGSVTSQSKNMHSLYSKNSNSNFKKNVENVSSLISTAFSNNTNNNTTAFSNNSNTLVRNSANPAEVNPFSNEYYDNSPQKN